MTLIVRGWGSLKGVQLLLISAVHLLALSVCPRPNKHVGSKRCEINILCNLKCFNILYENSETTEFEKKLVPM